VAGRILTLVVPGALTIEQMAELTDEKEETVRRTGRRLISFTHFLTRPRWPRRTLSGRVAVLGYAVSGHRQAIQFGPRAEKSTSGASSA
jgi:hypothetical protein